MNSHGRAIHNRVEAYKGITPTNERSEERKQLESDIKAFLKTGGKIQKIKTGVANFKSDIEKGRNKYFHIPKSTYRRGVN